ncbi:MAG: methyltransferase domain-containing protein [Bdellovibrionales bacterium]|nr:methyltransferase domain-containing protein [Bdellovibrionales bacterium]
MSIPSIQSPGFSYETRAFELLQGEESLTIEALHEARLEDRIVEPYFAQIWPACQVLSEILKNREPSWKGLSVLELGCGLAVPSMWLAKWGANVIATDGHPEVPAFLTKNLEINGLSDRVRFENLDWESSEVRSLGNFDWIIASEILYDEDQVKALAFALSILRGPKTKTLIIDPGRPYLETFLEALHTSLGVRVGLKNQTVKGRNYCLIDF